MKLKLVILLALYTYFGSAHASDRASTQPWTELNATTPNLLIKVSPGQEIYGEVRMEKELAYSLTSDFKSKMPGSMRLRFWFQLEKGLLEHINSDPAWDYYGARKGRAQAWHGIIGDVLGPDDHIGVRKRKGDGQLEWYVDNSTHNRMNTIWHRELKDSESELIQEKMIEVPNGNPLRRITYLGKKQGEVRFRLTELTPQGATRNEIYSYEVIPGEPTSISILGAELIISDISNMGATIKVVKPFSEIVDVLPTSGGAVQK